MPVFHKLFTHWPLLASKSDLGSSHPCSCTYRVYR